MSRLPRPVVRRARRWFWGLVVVAVLAMGGLFRAAQAPPSPAAGLSVAVSGLVLAAALTQAARILVRLDGRRSWRPSRRRSLGAGR